MKKIISSAVLASALLTCAVAEENAAFVGAQFGFGGLKVKSGESESYSGYRYGILAGCKQFFSQSFGARYYGVIDLGSKYTKGSNSTQIVTYNYSANADALYNFASTGDVEYGAFGGLSLGYANHTGKNKGQPDEKINGFDLGINLGLRLSYTNAHGFELYSRFGLLDQKKSINGGDVKLKQPYQVGLRYSFSF